MAQPITIEALEAIINRIRIVAPAVEGELSPELRILAERYSNMISDNIQLMDLDPLAVHIRPVAITLLGVPLDKRPHDIRQHRPPF